MTTGVRSGAQAASRPPEVILVWGGRVAHSDLAGGGSAAHSCCVGRGAPPGIGTGGLLAAGSNLPDAAGGGLAGPLASEMSEAAPISLNVCR